MDTFTDDEIMELWRSQGGQGMPDSVFSAALRAPGARAKYANQWNNRAWNQSRVNANAANNQGAGRANWNNWSTPTQGLSADGKSYGGVNFQTGRPEGNEFTNPQYGNLANAAGNNIGMSSPLAAREWTANYEAQKNKSLFGNTPYANTDWFKRATSNTYSDGTSKASTPLWQKQGLTNGGSNVKPPIGNGLNLVANGMGKPPAPSMNTVGTNQNVEGINANGLSNTVGHITVGNR